jgi:hypothetical protein
MRSSKRGHQIVLVIISSGVLLISLFWLILQPVLIANAMANSFFVKPGASGSCAQDQPCNLQTALGMAQKGDTIYVAQGTYTGSGAAVITVTRSITLAGGWDGAGSGAVNRDATLSPSTLDGESARRVVYISGNITPTLDGFTVANGNATGLKLSDCPSDADGCGGGIFSNLAHPIIANNTISNNVAAITTSGFPTRTTGYGGGLFLSYGANTIIRNNEIISNTGSIVNRGSGGGIFFWGPSFNGLQVISNQVLSNSASTQSFLGYGGGIWGAPDNSLFKNNIFNGNHVNGTNSNGSGAAIFQYGGNAHLLNNTMQGNYGADVVNLQYSKSVIEGNIMMDNNVLRGIQIQDTAGSCSTLGCPTLINNVISHSGARLVTLYGYDTSHMITVTLINNTLIGADSGYGVYIGNYVNVYMTNTLVASTTWGITTTNPISSNASVDHSLYWGNSNNGILGDNPVFGDPLFAMDGYHLSPGSAAIDAGIDVSITTDIDGDMRHVGAGVDIGADEFVIPIFLPVIIRN